MDESSFNIFSIKIGKELRLNNPSLRASSVSSYIKVLWRLVDALDALNYQIDYIDNIPFCLLKDYEAVGEYIHGQEKSPHTTKMNFTVLVSLLRGVAMDNPGTVKDALDYYREEFEKVAKIIVEGRMKQEPTEKELVLKDLNINVLKKGLKHHEKKMKENPADIETAVLLFAGTLATEFCLRNEPANIVISNYYLDAVEYPKTNFIWNKGRNKKMLVIRENKVRTGGLDPEKTLWITGHLNRIFNIYLRAYCASDIIPLIWKSKGDLSVNITGSGYCSMLKRVWTHMDLEMTSTLIRKIFAIDIRKEHGGKLTEEMKACDVLDHGIVVHNTNYVLFFE